MPRPSRSWLGWLWMAVGGMLFLFAVLAAAAACGGSNAAQPELNASVRRTGAQLLVENRDTFPWRNCEVEINPGRGGGWSQRVAYVPAGETIRGGLLAFTREGGERFNPATHAIETVRVACDVPAGYAVGYFRFGP